MQKFTATTAIMASSPTATAVHHFKTFYHTTTRQGHLPTFRLLDIPIEVRLLVYEAIARIELPTINTKGQLKHPHLDPCLHKIRHEIVSAVYHTVPLEFHNNLILERAGLSMLLAIFVPYSCFYALQTPFTKLFLGLAVFHAALACCFFLRE